MIIVWVGCVGIPKALLVYIPALLPEIYLSSGLAKKFPPL
jgi:hypothetical protein